MAESKINYQIKTLGPLTKRESEVLVLVAEGKRNNEIAKELVITKHTAKAHVCSIIHKMGVEERYKAVNAAINLGILAVIQT